MRYSTQNIGISADIYINMHTQLIYLVFLLFVITNVSAIEPNYKAYSEVLENHVVHGDKHNIQTSLVQYQKLENNPLLEEAILEISNFDTSFLSNRQEKIAFYINAYNAFTLSLIADNWPVKSIKDIGTWYSPVWKKKLFTLNNKKISLDEIEHNILRNFDEPRIHFTLCCAAVSCPDLKAEPYFSENLDEQFNEQVINYLNNHTKGLYVENNIIKVSKIFSWYENDFINAGGYISFISKYFPNNNLSNKSVQYLNYDWSINGPTIMEYSKSK